MIDFKQLMLFERHKMALEYEARVPLVVDKLYKRQIPSE